MVYVIGVDLGATNLRVAIADENGLLVKVSKPTIREGKGIDVSRQIITMVNEILEKTGISIDEIEGIGVGSIGPLDLKRGIIIDTPNLPFKEIPIVKPLRREFNKPVVLLNDCTTAVVGERYFGYGRGLDNIVYITISTGIGGGAYVDGHLLLGKDGNAVEIGHMVVDFEGRLMCGCGKAGHWEAYCSGRGIPNLVRMYLREKKVEKTEILRLVEGDLDKITAKTLFDAARLGDDIALEIVELIGRLNAIGIANVINVYDPELVTIGGSVALKNKELILEPIKRNVGEYAINRIPRIDLTPLKGDIVLYGAVALALGLEKIE